MHDRVLALLLKLERGTEDMCPLYWASDHLSREPLRHAPDCELAALIRELEG